MANTVTCVNTLQFQIIMILINLDEQLIQNEVNAKIIFLFLGNDDIITLNLKGLYSDSIPITDAIRSSRSKFMDWFRAYQVAIY